MVRTWSSSSITTSVDCRICFSRCTAVAYIILILCKADEFTFVNTVSENKGTFTKRQIASADKARDLYASLAYPLDADYKLILKSNQIKDCPVSVEDAKVALKIWGPNIAALKGKTTRSNPQHVVTIIVKIPVEIQDLHKLITISIDIFFFN
jgi:hypothetical protein